MLAHARSESLMLGPFDAGKCYIFDACAPPNIKYEAWKYSSNIMSGYLLQYFL